MFLFYFIFRTLKMFYIILSCCKHRIWEHTQYNLYYFKSYPQICFMTFYFLWFHFMHSTSITFIFFLHNAPLSHNNEFYLFISSFMIHLQISMRTTTLERWYKTHKINLYIFTTYIFVCVVYHFIYLFIYLYFGSVCCTKT